jgi:hypothetical protein
MKKVPRVTTTPGWLLFFYSVPSKPVSNRVKIWRKLAKAGAVQLKGAVYVLPFSEENLEFFQWLVSEVSAMGGEAAFTGVEKIDSMKDKEIIDLFVSHSDEAYQEVKKALQDVEVKVNSIRKGSRPQSLKGIGIQMSRVSRSLEEARRTDFFPSKTGAAIKEKMDALREAAEALSVAAPGREMLSISRKRREDFQGRTWVSRKKPFVDRMASAWLIRKFIDRSAVFKLMDEGELDEIGKDHVTFDLAGGEFTHVGDLCTFEVLVKTFGLKDKAVRKVAEIVHELDIKDDKYRNPEAKGLEEILTGIRKQGGSDSEMLEKGIAVFEMLYLSKAG